MEQAKFIGLTNGQGSQDIFREGGPAHELGLWLRALSAFCQVRDHLSTSTDQNEVVSRDWTGEVRLTRRVLLRCTQLSYSLLKPYSAQEDDLLADAETPDGAAAAPIAPVPASAEMDIMADAADRSFMTLAEALKESFAVCDALLEKPPVSLHTWASIGKTLTRQLGQLEAAQAAIRAEHHYSTANLQDTLVALTRRADVPAAFGPDLLIIFTELARLLRRLEFIQDLFKRDQPLKQTLPLFALIRDGADWLMEFIEACLARADRLGQTLIDALDATNYAIKMESRKVFTQELVGVIALRQAPAIYAKVEIAHGLLNNCFQQSTIGLAQLFDPALNGARLFNTLQTRLEQSLALRRDLWLLLQLVQRAEKEREQHPVSQLVASLGSFHDGSLHYLMYKDWEACERFIEEVTAARGALELTPVLNRFGAYLETLFNQVSLRTVLAEHAFDYPTL
jgi:hypothetical protein